MKALRAITLFFIYFICINTSFSQELLTLEDFRASVLDHNRELKNIKGKHEISKKEISVAQKDRYTALEANAKYFFNDQQTSTNGASVVNNHIYAMGITANQIIYKGGKINNRINLAKVIEEQNSELVNIANDEVLLIAETSYWNTVASNEMVKVWQRYLLYLSNFIKVVEERVNAGLAGQNELLTAKVRYNEVEIALSQSQANLYINKGQINFLIGRTVSNQFSISDSLMFNSQWPDTTRLKERAFAQRHEIKYYEYNNDLNSINEKLIKADYRPYANAGLNVSYGNGLSGADNGINVLSMATVGVPVTSWGKKNSQLSQNKLMASIYNNQLEEIKDNIALEIFASIVKMDDAINGSVIAQKSMNNALKNLEITDNQYKEGIASIIEVTEAQSFLQNAILNLINAKRNYYVSYAEFKKAVGEL